MSETLIQVEGLKLEFKTQRGCIQALNGISFKVQKGEVFGLVGETGCGKTVTALSLLRLLPPASGGNDVNVTWQSVVGVDYFLEYSTNLTASPAFLPLATNLVLIGTLPHTGVGVEDPSR